MYLDSNFTHSGGYCTRKSHIPGKEVNLMNIMQQRRKREQGMEGGGCM